MDDKGIGDGSVQSGKCQDTKLFDHLMVVYLLGVIAVSFYALCAF